MNINEEIGAEMRKQRTNKNLSLAQVADRMGVNSRNTISLMELGRKNITVGDILSFCKAVGCEIDPFVEIIENARVQR